VDGDSKVTESTQLARGILNRYLLIFRRLIFESSVRAGRPNLVAAPVCPEIRPLVSTSAASIISFSCLTRTRLPAPFILLYQATPGYSGEASQTQVWMRNGYTKGLVSYGGDRRIFRPQGDPLSSRVSDCLATPLALASSWKSKGAARRIVKDKGSGLIKPIETHRKRTDQCKELEDSEARPVSRQGRGKTPKSSLLHDDTACYWLFSALLL